jgi:thioredoxin-like negative regulator of GroEL
VTEKKIPMYPAAGMALLLFVWVLPLGCGSGSEPEGGDSRPHAPLTRIADRKEFNRIVSAAGDRLLVIDFYADWCRPCRELEPILAALAAQKRAVADIYRVNYDENHHLAELLGVHGIPFVAFVKNRTLIYSLMGLRPEETYREAIASFTRPHGAAAESLSAPGLESGGPPAPEPNDQGDQAQSAEKR